MTGQRFGRLVVEKRCGTKGGKTLWTCRCDCGNSSTVQRPRLLRGETKSCGCYHRDCCRERRTTHGARLHGGLAPEYTSWCGIVERCENASNHAYHNYGGRGIRVCERWRNSYEAFLEDMGPKPSGTSIDRVNNDGHYEPGNCRWATLAEQSRNRRNNVWVVLNGVRMVAADAGRALGLKPRSIHAALQRGNSIEQIIARIKAS